MVLVIAFSKLELSRSLATFAFYFKLPASYRISFVLVEATRSTL
jgi:hypothetical protein